MLRTDQAAGRSQTKWKTTISILVFNHLLLQSLFQTQRRLNNVQVLLDGDRWKDINSLELINLGFICSGFNTPASDIYCHLGEKSL